VSREEVKYELTLRIGAVLLSNDGVRMLDQQSSGKHNGLEGRKPQVGPGPTAFPRDLSKVN
jgi:hypothetical protein